MANDPDKDDADGLDELVMPRDPKLPATELLDAPEDDGKPTTKVGKAPDASAEIEFGDETVPGADRPSDEGNTLDEPMPDGMLGPLGDELAHEWDDDVETVVDEPRPPDSGDGDPE